MASNLIIRSLIFAVVFVGLAQKGFSLRCYTCYSTISWEDCFKKDHYQDCRKLDGFHDTKMVCSNVFVALKKKDDQQEFAFSASCLPKSPQGCNEVANANCKTSWGMTGEYKAVNCEVNCCETDWCNKEVSKGHVKSISILVPIISLLSSYSFQNFSIFMSFLNTHSFGSEI